MLSERKANNNVYVYSRMPAGPKFSNSQINIDGQKTSTKLCPEGSWLFSLYSRNEMSSFPIALNWIFPCIIIIKHYDYLLITINSKLIRKKIITIFLSFIVYFQVSQLVSFTHRKCFQVHLIEVIGLCLLWIAYFGSLDGLAHSTYSTIFRLWNGFDRRPLLVCYNTNWESLSMCDAFTR